MVSIGPLHNEDDNLQEFEEQKAIYLHDLLGRLDSSPAQTLEACVRKVSDSMNRIKACYAGLRTFSDI